jgi:hypothetical protein
MVGIATSGAERVTVDDSRLTVTRNPAIVRLSNNDTTLTDGQDVGSLEFYQSDSNAVGAAVKAVASGTIGLVSLVLTAGADNQVATFRGSSGRQLFLGNGPTDAAPESPVIRAPGGSGTDVAGGALGIYGGLNTGSAAGGAVSIYTSPAGSSGSSLATPVERVRVDSAGLLSGTGTSLGAWTTYTPTLSGTGWAIGNGTAVGYHTQVGQIGHVRGSVTFGSTSTFGAAPPEISLPYTSRNANPAYWFTVRLRDVSLTSNYIGAGSLAANSNSLLIAKVGADGLAADVTSAVPFTWANGDIISFNITYEVA